MARFRNEYRVIAEAALARTLPGYAPFDRTFEKMLLTVHDQRYDRAETCAALRRRPELPEFRKQFGHVGLAVVGFSGITRGIDAGSAGQRIHHPLTVTKHVDQASPKIYKACCTGEQCTVTLDHYRIGPVGVEEKYFTIKLEDAIVVSVRKKTPLTFLPENKPYADMEEVSFTYSKITWTYNDGNIEYVDDWKK